MYIYIDTWNDLYIKNSPHHHYQIDNVSKEQIYGAVTESHIEKKSIKQHYE